MSFMGNPRNTKLVLGVMACVIFGALVYIVSPNGNASQEAAVPAESEPAAVDAPSSAEPEADDTTEPLDSKSRSELESKLNEIVLSANEYLTDNDSTTSLITQNGVLYNAAAKMEITAEYLREIEYLSDNYFLESVKILYISYDDFAEMTDVYDYRGNTLSLYAAAEADGGFLLVSKERGAFKVEGDRFDNMMERYNVRLGETRRITGSSEEYHEINEAVKRENNVKTDFYIRYGMRNDKYAVVIVSPKTDVSIYYQYVLCDDGKGFYISHKNLEKADKPYVLSNITHNNLDASLMPAIDVPFYLGMVDTNLDGMTAPLIRDGLLEADDDDLEYAAAIADFLFAKYANGQYFVGHKVNNMWILAGVLNAENALGFFNELDDSGPSFVIVWE